MFAMNKKVLVLSGSARKGGNSDMLCDQFILGAKEAGHQAEKIFLNGKKINFCKGCEDCQESGECVQKDDMAGILEKMVAADVVVMATPVYFHTMNGQMKTLIDRTYPRYSEICNKDMYFIVTAADGRKQAMDRTLEGLREFVICLNGVKEKGVIYGTGVWAVGAVKGNKAMSQAFEMGKQV
jgi:multimeric flavodoxin WrbA